VSFKFIPDRAGIERLAKGPGMRDFVTGKAKRVESLAVASAPVDSGAYRASIGSTPADVTADGVTATVYSTDPAALMIEFGTSDTPPHRTLSSSVTAAGLKFKG
jgi:hypothetical protein